MPTKAELEKKIVELEQKIEYLERLAEELKETESDLRARMEKIDDILMDKEVEEDIH